MIPRRASGLVRVGFAILDEPHGPRVELLEVIGGEIGPCPSRSQASARRAGWTRRSPSLWSGWCHRNANWQRPPRSAAMPKSRLMALAWAEAEVAVRLRGKRATTRPLHYSSPYPATTVRMKLGGFAVAIEFIASKYHSVRAPSVHLPVRSQASYNSSTSKRAPIDARRTSSALCVLQVQVPSDSHPDSTSPPRCGYEHVLGERGQALIAVASIVVLGCLRQHLDDERRVRHRVIAAPRWDRRRWSHLDTWRRLVLGTRTRRLVSWRRSNRAVAEQETDDRRRECRSGSGAPPARDPPGCRSRAHVA